MRTRALHHVDDDLRQYVVDGMRRRGMQILEGAEPVAVNGRDGGGARVTVRLASGEEVELADRLRLPRPRRAAERTPAVRRSASRSADRAGRANKRMQTSVPGVYAIGDLIGGPMEMFKARKSGVTAARNIMGEDLEFDYTEYPDFLHTTYEVTWVGLTEAEARGVRRCDHHPDAAVRGGAGHRPPAAALRRGHHAVRVQQAGAVRLPEAGRRRGHRARCSAPTTAATGPRTRSSTWTTSSTARRG